MSLGRAEMGCFVHSMYIVYTVPSGSADPKIPLVCSIAEAAKAASAMGRLTLHQTVSFVVILHFMTHFSIESPPGTGYICGSVDVFIFAAKGEGSPTCPPFAGHRRGRSLRNTHVLNLKLAL